MESERESPERLDRASIPVGFRPHNRYLIVAPFHRPRPLIVTDRASPLCVVFPSLVSRFFAYHDARSENKNNDEDQWEREKVGVRQKKKNKVEKIGSAKIGV
jgi:hypothetical protein